VSNIESIAKTVSGYDTLNFSNSTLQNAAIFPCRYVTATINRRTKMNNLTHFNQSGEATMVNIGDKDSTLRKAVAAGRICMQAQTLEMIRKGEHGKGDVLGVARIAGIMGAKKTADLIPLCHPLAITKVSVDFRVLAESNSVVCAAEVQTHGQTGVEMEALTAVQVALLTIYDMCKAVDRGMEMHDIGLIHKSGGKSGEWNKPEK
jgi:cyclic pyranopterin phosphate synthase